MVVDELAPAPTTEEYERLLREIKELQAAGKLPVFPTHEQRVSFAYGNAALSNPNITRELVEQVARENPPQDVRYSSFVTVKTLQPVPFAITGRRGAWRLADVSTTLDPRQPPPWQIYVAVAFMALGFMALVVSR